MRPDARRGRSFMQVPPGSDQCFDDWVDQIVSGINDRDTLERGRLDERAFSISSLNGSRLPAGSARNRKRSCTSRAGSTSSACSMSCGK